MKTMLTIAKIAVFSADSKPYGLTYGEWTAKWWQWVYLIPKISTLHMMTQAKIVPKNKMVQYGF
jgi:hypothetical protein